VEYKTALKKYTDFFSVFVSAEFKETLHLAEPFVLQYY